MIRGGLLNPDGEVIDSQPGIFVVTTFTFPLSDAVPADIPRDAIRYGFIEFFGFNKNYEYLNRIVSACKEALIKEGHARLFIHYLDNRLLLINLVYHKLNNHLEFGITDKDKTLTSYSIDFSEEDVSIK